MFFQIALRPHNFMVKPYFFVLVDKNILCATFKASNACNKSSINCNFSTLKNQLY